MKITKAQQQAIARIANRMNINYREARRTVQPTFGMDGAVVMPFAGMWLAIETDGYTHS